MRDGGHRIGIDVLNDNGVASWEVWKVRVRESAGQVWVGYQLPSGNLWSEDSVNTIASDRELDGSILVLLGLVCERLAKDLDVKTSEWDRLILANT